ncbi:MAG: HAD family hydrolase [Kiritimatiellae bacterium]|nr:HAD family hydrolase [Kiritimatiellia bacterium]
MHYFFDFDGTLADTEKDIKLAWRAAIEDLGLECPHFDKVYRTGPSINEITKELFPSHPAIDALIAEIRRAFALRYDTSGFPSTAPYPGVEQWLKSLKSQGHKVYIATNKRCRALELILRKFGWDSWIDGWWTSDQNPANVRRKPVFLHDALVERGIAPSDAVMIGDTKDDIEAGRANGLRTVAVAWGYGNPADLALADEIITAI